MSVYRNLGYSLFGSGGAAGSILVSRGCLGGCTGCFGCVAFSGLLVGLALVKVVKRNNKEEKHGLATADH
jgi:hypothetical protein